MPQFSSPIQTLQTAHRLATYTNFLSPKGEAVVPRNNRYSLVFLQPNNKIHWGKYLKMVEPHPPGEN